MLRRDWSLVFFTTLSQWSIGIVLCLAGLSLLSGHGVVFMETGPSPANLFFLALLLIMLATILSFLHLGNPVNAPRSLNNLATSWLSREILGINLFTLSVIAIFVYSWRTDDGGFMPYLLITASLAGIFLLWTMARVYLLPTVPGWNSAHTPLGFTFTALCLGLVSCLTFILAGSISADSWLGGFCATVLAAVLLLELISGFLRQRQLEKMDTGIDGPSFDRGALRQLFLLRMGALLIAIIGIGAFILLAGTVQEATVPWWLVPSLVLAVLQEFIGRMIFYGSYFRVGL